MEQIKISIPSLVNDSPQSAALLSKLNTDQSANQRSYTQYNWTDIATSTATKIKNNESVLELLPDLELCIQIVTSSMLDPNGMIDNNLIYTIPDIKLPSDIRASIVEMIRVYIDNNYGLADKLKDIIREAYFTKGAYVEAIIPEASLDRLINKSAMYRGQGGFDFNNQESLDHPDNLATLVNKTKTESNDVRYIGNHESVFTMNTESVIGTYGVATYLEGDGRPNFNKEARDSFKAKSITQKDGIAVIKITESDINLQITDDIDVLRLADFRTNQLLTKKKHEFYVNTNQEALTVNENNHYLDVLFRSNLGDAQSDVEFAITDDEAMRDSVSKPLVLKLPVESVIPVYAKNNPAMHVGYFVLLDETGNPLDILNDQSPDICGLIGNSSDPKTNIISKARHGLYGAMKNVPEVNNIEMLYGDIVDHMIKSRLRNGDFEGLVDIRETADIYRVMLNRALAAKQTKLLYLPGELVQYYAFEYRANGTGLSQIEKNILLASMAGMLLFANVKSSIQNSIPITDINLVLDENDPNPLSTGHKFMSELIRSNNVAFPLGLANPTELHDWVINQGYRMSIDSPFLPKMTIDRSTSFNAKGDAVDANGDVYQKIIGMIMKSLGIPPEVIENGFKEDFAATVVMKNKLLAKRIILLQNDFSKMLTKHVRKYITNDKVLRDRITGMVIQNKADIKAFIKPTKKQEKNATKDLIPDEDNEKLNKIKDSELADYIVAYYRDNLWVDIPRPDFGSEDEKAATFDAAVTKIETAVDKLYSPEMFGKEVTGPNGGNVVEAIKAIVKAGAIRKFMVDQNYLPEVTSWYTEDDQGKITLNYMEENSAFTKAVSDEYLRFINDYYNMVKKMSEKLGKAGEQLDNMGEASDGFGGDGMSSDSGSSEGEGGEGEGTSDEFGDEFGSEEGEEGGEDETGESGEEGDDEGGDLGSEGEANESGNEGAEEPTE